MKAFFIALLAVTSVANAKISTLQVSHSMAVHVEGQYQWFLAYPPESGEGPGEWRTETRIYQDSVTRNTIPLTSHSIGGQVPDATEPGATWIGGTRPSGSCSLNVAKWESTTAEPGKYSSFSFEATASQQATGTHTGSSIIRQQLNIYFTTTERMQISRSGWLYIERVPFGEPEYDHNGYLLPGTYNIVFIDYVPGPTTLKLSLTPIPTDSDNDGISDHDETETYHTNPLDTDSDDDGLTDKEEALDLHTDPIDFDSDDDGFGDGFERSSGKSPLDANSFPAAALTIRPAVELRVATKLGVRYRVQSSTDLQTWTDTPTVIEGTGDQTTSVFEPVDMAARYWRVREEE